MTNSKMVPTTRDCHHQIQLPLIVIIAIYCFLTTTSRHLSDALLVSQSSPEGTSCQNNATQMFNPNRQANNLIQQQDHLYYYARTRKHPSHLRVAEEMKNPYADEVKYESTINGTKYEYYKSARRAPRMSYDELVYETLDKIFRHRLSPFYIHHYDRDEDKRRSSDPAKVSQETCARDLLYLVEKLPKRSLYRNPFPLEDATEDQDERLTPELTALFDSYARQEAGLLMGNTYWVGSYEQCVKRHIFELVDTPSASSSSSSGSNLETGPHQHSAGSNRQQQQQQVISFKGRYCVSSLKSPKWDQMIEAKKRNARNYFKTERQIRDYSKLFRIQLGVCLPDSCDSTALERHQEEIKLLTKSMLEPRYADYDLIDLYCLPDEASPLRQWSASAILFLLFAGLWSSAVLVATLGDVLELFDTEAVRESTRKASGMSYFVCWFSLRANYRKLMHVSLGAGRDKSVCPQTLGQQKKQKAQAQANQSQEQLIQRDQVQVDLRFLNAFKAIIMFWIINGHIMLLMVQTAKNILDSDNLLNGLMHFLIGATFGVDLFFTMTGFLTAYLLFNSGHAFRMKPATWVYLSFHRYWRLAPMYLLTFWFSRSVMQSLGSGPLWDYGTSDITFRGLCNTESWWYPLTLTSNLHGLFEECMITSWYISCDMQFWLVSPVFIYLLANSPANGWFVTSLAILGTTGLRYDSLLGDKSARYDELVQPRADIFMRVSHDLPSLYTHPHTRIAAYLVGLLAGHYVYMIKSGKWTSVLTEDLAQTQGRDEKLRELSASAGRGCEETKSSSGRVGTVKEEGQAKTVGLFQDDISPPHDASQAELKTNEINDMRIESKTDSPEQNKKKTTTTTTNEQIKIQDEASRRAEDEMTTKTTTSKRAQRSRLTRNSLGYLGLTLFLLMANVSYLLANYYPQHLIKYSKQVAAVAYSLDHLAMSIGASLVIVTMCLGQWSRLVRFLSHPNWTRLSKINYALLLFQCEAIYYQIFRYDEVPTAGTKELINVSFNLLVTLYPVAFLATLVFEFPLANIEKVILGGGGGGKSDAKGQK